MTAVSLFDTLSRRSSANPADADASLPQLTRFATELVDAALLDWERVRHYQDEFASNEWTAQSLEIEHSVHEMVSIWAAEAEAVQLRAQHLVAAGAEIPLLKSLQDTLIRARAELKITPDQIARAMAGIARGNVVAAKDLRDELRSRLRP